MIESKFLTSAQLWQDFDRTKDPLGVTYVEQRTEEYGITVRSLFFDALSEAEGAVRAYARILTPQDYEGEKFILYLPSPDSDIDPFDEASTMADLGYQVGYVDLRGIGDLSTQYSGCFSYGRWEEAKDNLYLATPSALVNPTFLWTKIVARFVTLLETYYPRCRVVAFAERLSSLVVWPLVASVPMLAGVSVLGTGLVEEDVSSEAEENQRKWAIALSPQTYARRTHIPMMVVTATNHYSRSFDKIHDLVALMPEEGLCSTVISHGLRRQISLTSVNTLWQWIESQYKSKAPLPHIPTLSYALSDGQVHFSVVVDDSQEVESVYVHYSFNEENPEYRSWHTKVGDGSPVSVRVGVRDRSIVAYTQVNYKGGIQLSSPCVSIQLPDELPRARMTPNKLLYDTSMPPAFFAETKVVNLSLRVFGIVTAPDGIAGVCTHEGRLISYCVGESNRLLAEGELQISAYCTSERTIDVVLTVEEDGKYRDYTASVYLKGDGSWQRIRLASDDFRDEVMLPLTGWQGMKKIEFRGAEGVLFNNMLWV